MSTTAPRPASAYDDGVLGLVALDARRRPPTPSSDGVEVDEQGTDHRGLKASRKRPNTDLARSHLPVGLLLVAERGELAEQLLLTLVEAHRGLDDDA